MRSEGKKVGMKRWKMGLVGLVMASSLWAGCRPREVGVLRWRESIEHLNEGAQCCFRQAHLYDAAAKRAAREELHEAERLFAAMACVEQIQEQRFIEAIGRLGGGYTPPYRPRIYLYATHQNLLGVLYTPSPYGALEVEQVLAEGNRYAARLMVRHIASENRCRRAVEHYLHRGERSSRHYAVCPVCGYLTDNDYPDPYCPQCGEHGERFRCFYQSYQISTRP